VSLLAEVLAAVHRRNRVLRQPHADGGGHFRGTLIHHAARQSCTLAQAEVAIAVGVIGAAFGGSLVLGSGLLLLRITSPVPALVGAVRLAAEARSADKEDARASPASLEPKLRVVHRRNAATTTNLPRTPSPSIVCSKPASIG
jgi:hypothetical protein